MKEDGDDEAEQAEARLAKVLEAYDICDSNRGRFSTVEMHDCRCPKSRPRRVGPNNCECGSDALEAALAAARGEEPKP